MPTQTPRDAARPAQAADPDDRPIFRKPLFWIVLVTVLLLPFGGTLLPLLLHGVILLLEVMELVLETVIEHVLGVGPRTAQVITAWIGLFVFLSLAEFARRRLWRAFSGWRERSESDGN